MAAVVAGVERSNTNASPARDLARVRTVRRALSAAAAIAGTYFVLAATWILLSDHAVDLFAPDAASYRDLQTWKGSAFVSMTALLLFLALLRDYRRRERQRAELAQAWHALEGMNEAVVIAATDGAALAANPAFTASSGYAPAELPVPCWTALFDASRTPAAVLESLQDSVSRGQSWAGELWARRRAGASYPALASLSFISEHGLPDRAVIVLSDISKQKEYEQRLEFLSRRDPLTHVSNRSHFLRCLAAQAQEHSGETWIFALGFDAFASVNDSAGAEAGNQLLIEAARRLQEYVHDIGQLARLGGDTFALWIANADMHNFTDADAVAFVEELRRALKAPYLIGDERIVLSLSVGISCLREDSTGAQAALQGSESALAAAKQAGRDCYRLFSTDLQDRARTRLVIASRLDEGLQRDEFHLVFQPRVAADRQRVVAVEALLRWQSKTLGAVPPDQFIPIAEVSGFIDPLGQWVLNEAIAAAKRWQQAGLPIRVAVNVSVRQLTQTGFAEQVVACLRAQDLPAHLLELEVTESTLSEEPERMLQQLERLKSAGVALAIDDFGTGYSSMSYLKRFPVDYLKIDKAFVGGLPSDGHDTAIVRAIIALAHSLDLLVVAEGVETRDQAQLLSAMGCAELQGYLISRPLPEAQLLGLLRSPGLRIPSLVR